MDRNMIDYFPYYMREYDEIAALSKAYQKAASDLWERIELAWSDQYIDTLDINGCKRWEDMLGINDKGNYTLEERRMRISLALLDSRPYSFRQLQNTLTRICGEGRFNVELFPGEYKLVVWISLESTNSQNDVEDMLKKIIPANIIYNTALMYNTYDLLSGFTYDELSRYTYEELFSGVLSHVS